MTHHLDIIGTSTAEVVTHIGGWVYDRAAAGWQITVLVPEECDARAIHVLGADHHPLERVGRAVIGPVRQHAALGVSAHALRENPWAAAIVGDMLDAGNGDVTLWGVTDGTREPRTTVTRHRLSVAARAFKRHALVAAGVDRPAADPFEHLWSTQARTGVVRPGLTSVG